MANARTAFEVLKAKSELAGKNLVNISAVAEEAGIQRKYLYGKIDSPDTQTLEELRGLGEAIKAWKLDVSKNPEKVSIVEKSKYDLLKEERDTLAKQNFKLIEEKYRLRNNSDKVVEQRDSHLRLVTELEARVFDLQAQKESRPSTLVKRENNVLSVVPPSIIISPDRELMIDGRYQYEDEYLREVAWTNAMDQLKKELVRPLPTALYITIGIQGAGKSTWAEDMSPDKRAVIFDAMNLNRADRHKVIHISKGSTNKDLWLCAVCFPIDVTTAKARNAERKADRRVPAEAIDQAAEKLEFPTVDGPLGTEGFDEILIVRGKA